MKDTAPPIRKSRTIRVRAQDLPPWTQEDSDRLAAATAGPIDTSDSPPITQEDIDTGRVRIVRRPAPHPTPLPAATVPVSLRLDADLVEWFKGDDEAGYAERMNVALQEYRAWHTALK